MSKAYKCDICGAFYNPYNHNCASNGANGIEFIREDHQGTRMLYGGHMDCCPRCMEAINDLFKSLEGEVRDNA